MIKNMKIGTKLILGFLCIMALFLIASSQQNYSLRQLKLIEHKIADSAAEAIAVSEITGRVERSSAMTADALVNRAATEARQAVDLLSRAAAKDFDTVKAISETDSEKKWAGEFQEHYGEYLEIFKTQLLPALAQQENAGGMSRVNGLLNSKRELAAAALASIADARVKKSQEAKERFYSLLKRTVTINTCMFLINLLISSLIAAMLIKSIRNPVIKAAAMAREISRGDLEATIDVAQRDETGMLADTMRTMTGNLKGLVRLAEKISLGDLTVKVKPLSEKDMLGHALKNMVEKLSSTISEIHATSDHVTAGAAQMSSTSQSLSRGATEQASSLEEISGSMNEIASQIRHSAESASQADKLAREAKLSAEQGNAQMGEMLYTMREINDSGRSISKIIKVIDEIAFQTNLLALNAAVEAARAGKYGKGFAVVAQEVRNLAGRSAQAARETADLIESTVLKVNAGQEIADKTAMGLYTIFTAAEKMTDIVAEIAAASNEQAEGMRQITQGLAQVDQVTQQTTAHAEESAAAAEELDRQAKLLQQLVSIFSLHKDDLPDGASFSERRSSQKAIKSGWVNLDN